MNKILLITTQGCAGCRIMERLIGEAINKSSKEIEFHKKDFKEVKPKFLRDNGIRDYPTTVFIKDDSIRFIYTGTNPMIVILRWIDVYFK